MITQQRQDLQMNIPALRKLDAMLLVSMGMLYLGHSLNSSDFRGRYLKL
jgi:hypothetical protein